MKGQLPFRGTAASFDQIFICLNNRDLEEKAEDVALQMIL